MIAEDREGYSFRACKEALLKMGHSVEMVNLLDVAPHLGNSFLARVVHKITIAPLVHRLRRAIGRLLDEKPAFAPDLILIGKGQYIAPETIRWLRERTGAFLFNWQTDDYFSPSLSSVYAIRAIPEYDCIFAHTRSNLPELLRRGARRAEYLPHGADPGLFQPVQLDADPPFETDVLFVGNWRPERAQTLEALVHLGTPYRLLVSGMEWQRLSQRSALRPYIRFERVPWSRYAHLLRCSKISLVFLVYFDTGTVAIPLRLFEIAAAGGFMLVEEGRAEAAEFFAPGKEIACFRDVQDLKRQIEYFLLHEEERRRIAFAGQQRALREGYFYSNRMEQLMRVFMECRQQRRGG